MAASLYLPISPHICPHLPASAQVGVGGAGGVMEVDREEERLREQEAEAALEEVTLLPWT